MVRQTSTFVRVIHRLRQSITRNSLLPPGCNILLAISGGQDSLALGESLRHLQQSHNWNRLSLAHCDHRWPHDDGIADHVECYARTVGLPLHIIDAARCKSRVGFTEGAAREWRYAELALLARGEGYDCVVTAHTKTDLAETVLFNLAHGAGADGLASLTWDRALCENVRLVRPFLAVSRSETAAICVESGVDVWHDVYNADRRYARNRIRNEVMPVLAANVNTHVEDALARTAHLLREESLYLEEEAERVCREVLQPAEHAQQSDREADESNDKMSSACSRSAEESVTVAVLDRSRLSKESVAIQRRVVRQLLRFYTGLSFNSATFAQVDAVVSLLHAEVGQSVASLSGNASAVVVDDNLIALKHPSISGLRITKATSPSRGSRALDGGLPRSRKAAVEEA